MTNFELQQLRDLPIEGVAERLGLRVERHKCLCPFHDDHHASMSFSTSRNTFRCWACGAHGGTIDLVMQHLGKGFVEACQWLSNESPTPSLPPRGEEKKPKVPPRGDLGGVYARFFLHPFLNEAARHFLFDERRLDERVVRWCRLTSWKDKQGVPWLQIPYYDRDGKLVGVQNRNLKTPSNSPVKGGEKKSPSGGSEGKPPLGNQRSAKAKVWRGSGGPRFRFPAGSRCSIYNLPVLNLLKPGEDLYITEGCSDCWAMLSSGHKAIAIPSATLLTREDMELLKSLGTSPYGEDGRGLSFHMYPDRDEPGERLFLQLQKVLPNLTHHQLPPGCKDYSDYYLKLKN